MQSEWACAVFEDTFGKAAELVVEAPGRVNLIGEHTDYSDGFVMPAALPYGVSLAARATDGPSRLYSVARGWAKSFQVAEVEPGSTRGWANYAAGMAWALRQAGMPVDTNAEVVVANDLPIGAGVSSSAAMEVAFGWLWLTLSGFPVDPLQVARIAQTCENQYVGVNCGLMDMAASRSDGYGGQRPGRGWPCPPHGYPDHGGPARPRSGRLGADALRYGPEARPGGKCL